MIRDLALVLVLAHGLWGYVTVYQMDLCVLYGAGPGNPVRYVLPLLSSSLGLGGVSSFEEL